MRDLARLSVLLVEDNELDARSIMHKLDSDIETDFSCRHVGTLASASDALMNGSHDCILLDLSLPDSEGLIALDAIRQRAPEAPIVVLTGLDDPKTALEAVDRGAEDYLIKSRVEGDVVARAIRYAVTRHHTDSALRTATDLLRVAQDRERIGRDLHDTVIQQLFATGMGLQSLIGRTDDRSVREGLNSAVGDIDDAIQKLRQAIFDLHLATDDATLAGDIEEIVERLQPTLGFKPETRIGDVGSLSPELRNDVVAIVREALSNVAKHARATAAEVVIDSSASGITVSVSDNGVGFRRPRSDPDDGSGHGLRNMQQRAAQLSGTFRTGPGPGGGGRIVWTVPRR